MWQLGGATTRSTAHPGLCRYQLSFVQVLQAEDESVCRMEPTDKGWPLGFSCTLLKEMRFALAEDFGYWTGLTASGRAQQGDIAELALDDLDAEIMVEVHNQSGGIATGVVHTGELLQVGKQQAVQQTETSSSSKAWQNSLQLSFASLRRACMADLRGLRQLVSIKT